MSRTVQFNALLQSSTSTSLTFPAGTDMSTLEVGDVVTQEGFAYDNLTDWVGQLEPQPADQVVTPELAFDGDANTAAKMRGSYQSLKFKVPQPYEEVQLEARVVGDLYVSGVLGTPSFSRGNQGGSFYYFNETGTYDYFSVNSYTTVAQIAFVRINGVDLIQGQGIPATITAKVTSISGTTVNVDSGGFTNGISVTGPEKKIPTIQDTDTFLVQRGSSFYKSNKASLMDKIQDDDYMLVARGSTNYKIKGSVVKEELAGGSLPKFNINECFKSFDYQGNATDRSFDVGFDCRASAGGCLILIMSGADNTIASFNTMTGPNQLLYWNQNAEVTESVNTVTSFNSNGFSIGSSTLINTNNRFYKAFVWKVHKGFFDMGSYDGDTTDNRAIAHNIGAAPPLITWKRTGKNPRTGYTYVEPLGIQAVVDFGLNRGAQSRAPLVSKYPDAENFYVQSYYTNVSGFKYYWFAMGGTTGSEEYPVKVGTYKAAATGAGQPPNQCKTGGTKAQVFLTGTIEVPSGGNTGVSYPPVLTNRSGMTNVANQSFMVPWSYQGNITTTDKFNLTDTTVELPGTDGYLAFNPAIYWYYCIGE